MARGDKDSRFDNTPTGRYFGTLNHEETLGEYDTERSVWRSGGDSKEEAIHAAARDAQYERAKRKAESFGVIVTPAEDTLQGYKRVLRHETEIQFSRQNYGIFDDIVVQNSGLDRLGQPAQAAFNPGHKYFNDFAPMRRNLAMLRNYLLVKYPPDGENGPANVAKIQGMAAELGKALAGPGGGPMLPERWWHTLVRLFTGRDTSKPIVDTFMRVSNMPDRGASYMYDYLQKGSSVPGASFFTGMASHDWKLPPLEETPFSVDNMRRHSRSSRMTEITNAFEAVTEQMHDPAQLAVRKVDELNDPQKEVSVQHGKDILENLRILMTTGEEQKVDVEDPHVHEARLALQIAINFRNNLASLARYDPNLMNDPEIGEALSAFEKLSYRYKEQDKDMLKEEARPKAAEAMEQRAAKTPTKHKTKEPIALTLLKVEAGLNKVEKMHRKMAGMSKRAGIGTVDFSMNTSKIRAGLDGTMSGAKVAYISEPTLVSTAKRLNEVQPEVQQVGPTGPTK